MRIINSMFRCLLEDDVYEFKHWWYWCI